MIVTEEEAYEMYDDMLNEIASLDGIVCNPFSQLLQAGDPIAYNCGFNDFCDSQEIEIIEEG